MEIENLNKVYPFSYLTRHEKSWLLRHCKYCIFKPKTIIIKSGDLKNNDYLFILCQGVVSVVIEGKKIGEITAPSYFGERAAFFSQQRRATILANEKKVICISVSIKHIFHLFKKNISFRYAFASSLRNKQRIFDSFYDFINLLLVKRMKKKFSIKTVLKQYQKLIPALHEHCNEQKIDFSALNYAIKRLPDTVTTLKLLILSEDMPDIYKSYGDVKNSVIIKNKKNFYNLSPHKILTILRDDLTDYIYMVSILCIYQIEIQKILNRIFLHPPFYKQLQSGKLSSVKKLPFSNEELKELERIFPENLNKKLKELILQKNEIKFQFIASSVRYHSLAAELWVDQIKETLFENLGKDILETEFQVHIISSNAHSVTNCLSYWVHKHVKSKLNLKRYKNLKNINDRVYAATHEMLKKNSELESEKIRIEKLHGIYHLTNNCLTGINISIIDLRKLSSLDEDIKIISSLRNKKVLIFNIDYAYGKQAETIIRNLILLFNKKIASISVFGKAGGVIGKRGELMLPDYFIMQENDVNYSIENNNLSQDDFLKVNYRKKIHTGPLLTVLGTLIQNKEMLKFYRYFWHVIGMEMEGGYFIQEINRAKLQNLLDSNIVLRFAYYISDTPLLPGQSLASPMTETEGIPAVYSITRAILYKIFASIR